jgi:hypothetical protein
LAYDTLDISSCEPAIDKDKFVSSTGHKIESIGKCSDWVWFTNAIDARGDEQVPRI